MVARHGQDLYMTRENHYTGKDEKDSSTTSSTNSGGPETPSSPIVSDSLSTGANLQLLILKLNDKNYVEWA